jgi:DNA polymerase (family 10)
MSKLDAKETARLLVELSRRATLAGGNPYRARAYRRAADALAAITSPLEEIVAEKRLREIPGVGEAIADIIEKLHRTGTHPTLEEMRKEIPAGVLEILAVPGLRPEKVQKLYRDLGIASLADLEQAARSGQLLTVKGFGPVLQRKILEGIEIGRRGSGARHLHRAGELLALAERDLRGRLRVDQVMPAGDFRRGAELVFDLALVAQVPSAAPAPAVAKNGDVAIHIADPARFGIALLLATGSPDHLRELSAVAEGRGLALSPQGLTRGGAVVAAKTEAEIYAALGLQFIPPELREGRGETDLAARRALPPLVEETDLRGILHAHTVASDGVNTLADMAAATRARGYAYFGVADHSQAAYYARGLSVEAIERQRAEIAALNASYGGVFRVFGGIESDILADGSLDYPEAVLAGFDFVVASVHSGFRRTREEQTARILRAVRNPYTAILGHMTGRQLLRRDGYEVDIERILAACAEHAVAVEINANPWRLDLDWRWHQAGIDAGCVFSVNPDAHSTSEIDLTRWGVEMARKGGLTRDKIINCMTADQIAAWFAGKRQKKRQSRTNPTRRGLGRVASASRR